MQRKALGSFPMLKLMEPYVTTFLKGLGKSAATTSKKETCVKRFLSEGSDLVSDEEVIGGQINPETLLKLLKNVTEEEHGYLHPQSVCSIKIETKCLHLAYVKMFLEDLEINCSYFTSDQDAKRLTLYDIRRTLKQAAVRQKGPRKLHRVKRKVTSKEEQIPVKFIEELVQSTLISNCLRLIQGQLVRTEALQVRDSLITWICCHCVRRAEELKSFNIEEASTSTFIHAELQKSFKPAYLATPYSIISLVTRRKLELY